MNHTIKVVLTDSGPVATIEGMRGIGCDEIEVVLEKLAESLGTVTDSGATSDRDKPAPPKEQTWSINARGGN